MNKNIIWIALIFIVPLVIYYGLTKDKISTMPANAVTGDEIIKFASPMCYECQEMEKIFEEVFPKYSDKIALTKVDVTKRDNTTSELIRKYEVKLVPTTVFKNQDGNITRKIEGAVQSKVLENYMEELLHE